MVNAEQRVRQLLDEDDESIGFLLPPLKEYAEACNAQQVYPNSAAVRKLSERATDTAHLERSLASFDRQGLLTKAFLIAAGSHTLASSRELNEMSIPASAAFEMCELLNPSSVRSQPLKQECLFWEPLAARGGDDGQFAVTLFDFVHSADRWVGWMPKDALAHSVAELRTLTPHCAAETSNEDAFRDLFKKFCSGNGADFRVLAQLCACSTRDLIHAGIGVTSVSEEAESKNADDSFIQLVKDAAAAIGLLEDDVGRAALDMLEDTTFAADFAHDYLGSRGFTALTSALAADAGAITSLDVSNAGINNSTLQAVACRITEGCPALRSLRLRNNPLSEGCTQFACLCVP